MKRKVALTLILCVIFIPSFAVSADTNTISYTWGTGTAIDVTVVINSNHIQSGQHSIAITVKLIDLNAVAEDVHDIEVQYKIPGYYDSSIIGYDPITTTGNFQTKYLYFNYDTDWGISWLQIKFECMEDIPLSPDNHLVGDWTEVFLLQPDIPTTPTNPTEPNDPIGEPWSFDIAEDWWMLVLGGVGLIGIGAIVAVVIVRGRPV